MSDKKIREYAISVAMLIVQSRNEPIKFQDVSALALAIEGYIKDGVGNPSFLGMSINEAKYKSDESKGVEWEYKAEGIGKIIFDDNILYSTEKGVAYKIYPKVINQLIGEDVEKIRKSFDEYFKKTEIDNQ